jgi:hypothetical protein
VSPSFFHVQGPASRNGSRPLSVVGCPRREGKVLRRYQDDQASMSAAELRLCGWLSSMLSACPETDQLSAPRSPRHSRTSSARRCNSSPAWPPSATILSVGTAQLAARATPTRRPRTPASWLHLPGSEKGRKRERQTRTWSNPSCPSPLLSTQNSLKRTRSERCDNQAVGLAAEHCNDLHHPHANANCAEALEAWKCSNGGACWVLATTPCRLHAED